MNNLSLMIYLAEVCGRIQNASGFIFFMSAMLGTIAMCFLWAFHLIEEEGRRSTILIITGIWLFVSLLSGAIAGLTPSQKTLYLIAASEAGEMVVKSDETQEMLGDLKAIIKNRLKEELGEGK